MVAGHYTLHVACIYCLYRHFFTYMTLHTLFPYICSLCDTNFFLYSLVSGPVSSIAVLEIQPFCASDFLLVQWEHGLIQFVLVTSVKWRSAGGPALSKASQLSSSPHFSLSFTLSLSWWCATHPAPHYTGTQHDHNPAIKRQHTYTWSYTLIHAGTDRNKFS